MKKGILAAITLTFFMTACSGPEQHNQEDVISLTLAVFEENPEVNKQVAIFNQNNPGYHIGIEMYERSNQPEADGRARLQREIMSGNGPDIIDFGTQYTTGDIAGGYTENLLPYLEPETERPEEEYLLSILNAFCYREKELYAIPVGFTLQTFAGSRKSLGGLGQWNIEEMMETYLEKSEDMLLYPGQTKTDVFGSILTGSMEYYLDWENSTCRFEGEEFRNILAFANLFPEKLEISQDYSVKKTFNEGGALLLPLRIRSVFDICKAEYIFDEEDISYVGFPVEADCGTIIVPSYPVFAISISSGHKEACWDFISQFLDKEYQSGLEQRFPVSRKALEELLARAQSPEYTTDEEGNRRMTAKAQVLFEGEEPMDIYHITQNQADTLIRLIEAAQICNSTDYQLYNIIFEEAQVYFAGDRSLEETAAMIQSRASIYVSERAQ